MLYNVYKPKTNALKQNSLYGGKSTGFHHYMISVFFSYSEILESMLVDYAATEMGSLHDYSDAAPKGEIIRGNGITTFLLHVSQYKIFNQTNRVKTILIADALLKSFYSILGFKVIKDFATSNNFEEDHQKFHYDLTKSKVDQKNLLSYNIYKPSHDVLHFFVTIELT